MEDRNAGLEDRKSDKQGDWKTSPRRYSSKQSCHANGLWFLAFMLRLVLFIFIVDSSSHAAIRRAIFLHRTGRTKREGGDSVGSS